MSTTDKAAAAEELLARLRDNNIDVWLLDGQPRAFDPLRQLGQDLRQEISALREELIEVLETEPSKEWKQQVAGWPRGLRGWFHEMWIAVREELNLSLDKAQLVAFVRIKMWPEKYLPDSLRQELIRYELARVPEALAGHGA